MSSRNEDDETEYEVGPPRVISTEPAGLLRVITALLPKKRRCRSQSRSKPRDAPRPMASYQPERDNEFERVKTEHQSERTIALVLDGVIFSASDENELSLDRYLLSATRWRIFEMDEWDAYVQQNAMVLVEDRSTIEPNHMLVLAFPLKLRSVSSRFELNAEIRVASRRGELIKQFQVFHVNELDKFDVAAFNR